MFWPGTYRADPNYPFRAPSSSRRCCYLSSVSWWCSGTAARSPKRDFHTARSNRQGLGTLKNAARLPDFTLASLTARDQPRRSKVPGVVVTSGRAVRACQRAPMRRGWRALRSADRDLPRHRGVGRGARCPRLHYALPGAVFGRADFGGRITITLCVAGVPETFFVRGDCTLTRRWVGPARGRQSLAPSPGDSSWAVASTGDS